MTLVMYIPHKDGCILIADRQDTFEDCKGVCKQEVKKIFLVGENGPAIGCAGDTELLRSLFSRLEELKDVSNDSIFDILEKTLLEVARQWESTFVGQEPIALWDLEMVLITYRNGRIVPWRLRGNIKNGIDQTRCFGIGAGYLASGPFLNPSTTSLTEQEAVAFGEEIMRQVARLNYTVGPPEYHGYNLVKVTRDGKFMADSKPPAIEELDLASILKKIGKL